MHIQTHPHTHIHTHTVHMALVGYLIVFSFVTKPGQTLEFLLWGTIVPLNFLMGYHCSIVASTPQPMAYAFTQYMHCMSRGIPYTHVHVQPRTTQRQPDYLLRQLIRATVKVRHKNRQNVQQLKKLYVTDFNRCKLRFFFNNF